MYKDVIKHYDLLIDEDNDPVHDPLPLREYMDRWDGEAFIDLMELDQTKSVLEIGVGTGRLAVRTAPKCGFFCGIDISPKTIIRAKENLAAYDNVSLLTGDFMNMEFDRAFDVVYSSLTFMHIEDKQSAVSKAAKILNPGGRFVLSIDKNQSNVIDMETRKITVYPDDPDNIKRCIENAGLDLLCCTETDAAYIFAANKL